MFVVGVAGTTWAAGNTVAVGNAMVAGNTVAAGGYGDGAPICDRGGNRTPDLVVRSHPLYPAELPGQSPPILSDASRIAIAECTSRCSARAADRGGTWDARYRGTQYFPCRGTPIALACVETP